MLVGQIQQQLRHKQQQVLHIQQRRARLTAQCSATMSKTLQHCLVHNGKPMPCSMASGEWLKGAPRGAYTTARTVNGDLVFKLSSHIQRLATSANLMADADSRSCDHLKADFPLFHSDSLRPLVLSNMRLALQQLWQAIGTGHEAKLTLLLTETSDGTPDLWCHAEQLPPRPQPPVKLQIRGLPRVNAKAKDSEWVRQRQSLEASRAPGVNEVLLVSSEGELLEGLSSNFFVLSAAGEVVTAEAGVLSGTVRELVLQVCAELGVPVKLQPPRLADIESWQGAFISSTSRLLLPAAELLYEQPAGHLTSKVFAEQHPILLQLEQRVMAEVVGCSEPLESSGSQ